MTITERLELIRAGYSKEEIAAFEIGGQEEPKQAEQPEQPKQEEPKQAEQPEQPKQEEPKQNDNAVLAAINNLTRAIQMQNMQKIGLNTPGNMTAEQALAAGVFGNK